MSLHNAKLVIRPLVLASAALVVHIGAASAADSNGDTQQQMKELLAGISTAHSSPQSVSHNDKVARSTGDAQQLAKRLLLGKTGSRVEDTGTLNQSEAAGTPGKTEPRKRRVTYGDVQAAMRQVLLGQPHASDARYLAARPTR